MKTLVMTLALSGLVASLGCKLKFDKKDDDKPKAAACEQGLVDMNQVPPAFSQLGTAAGVVRRASCEKMVVGTTPQGQPVSALYSADNNLLNKSAPAESVALPAVYVPFDTSYKDHTFSIRRLVMVGEKVMVVADYRRNDLQGASNLFVYRLILNGSLDQGAEGFGPMKSGEIHMPIVATKRLDGASEPRINGEVVELDLQYFDTTRGPVTEPVRFVMSGREAWPKTTYPMPSPCTTIGSHRRLKAGNIYEFTQDDCSTLKFSFTSEQVQKNESLSLSASGISQESKTFGEIAVLYNGMDPMWMMRDSMGNLKSEYMGYYTTLNNETQLCGETVNPNTRYLVFSKVNPRDPAFLTNCWAL